MSRIAEADVSIQTSPQSVPSLPSWFGEVVLVVTYLKKQGVLTKLCEQVRFARKRFGWYEVVDFLAVLFGYAISGERTLEAFYQRLQPLPSPSWPCLSVTKLPSRSALSRFLAALTSEPVEALRTLFLDDLLSRPIVPEKQTGGDCARASPPSASISRRISSRKNKHCSASTANMGTEPY